jgi:hypothetical protein
LGQLELDKLVIRATVEDYLNLLDTRNWDGIASYFSDDGRSWYNFEPQALIGGTDVADWLRRIEAYRSTDHALSNLPIEARGFDPKRSFLAGVGYGSEARRFPP